MNSRQLFQYCYQPLHTIYDSQEAKSIAFRLIEKLYGLDKTAVLVAKALPSNSLPIKQLQNYIEKLLAYEPLQYVVGEAPFFGRNFVVTPATLIPRPETEELVQWMMEENKSQKLPQTLLDIGTGSGCIPITLFLELPQLSVYAIDNSAAALEVAKQNAMNLQATIHWQLLDILHQSIENLPFFDVIVSNPPYVCESEKAMMQPNVLQYEPPTALFVPNENPLLFYQRIANLAWQRLKPNGKLYFEINQQFGQETYNLLASIGFKEITIRKDLSGNVRFSSAIR